MTKLQPRDARFRPGWVLGTRYSLRLALAVGMVAGSLVSFSPDSRGAAPASAFWTRTMALDADECKNQVPPGDSCRGRDQHLAGVMSNGQVLVVGSDSTAQIFDPRDERWRPAASSAVARSTNNSFSIVLQGPRCSPRCGMVLVGSGGDLAGQDASMEVFNPGTGWETRTPPPLGLSNPIATLLTGPRCGDKCGMILVIGGASPLLWDPKDDKWSLTSPTVYSHPTGPTATALEDGTVLVTGGASIKEQEEVNGRSAEIYDPQDGLWRPTGKMSVSRTRHAAVLLKGPGCGENCGKVLVSGGRIESGTVWKSAELYDPVKGIFESTKSMSEARHDHFSMVELASGKVLVAGGGRDSGATPVSSAELYDPVLATWSTTSPMVGGHRHLPSILLPPGPAAICGDNCGKFLAAGGWDGISSASGAELFTPPLEIGGLNPNQGPAKGGTRVEINGTSLARVKSVTFDSTTLTCGEPLQSQCWADPQSLASKTIAISPPHAEGKVHVTVSAEVKKPDGSVELYTSPQSPNDLFEYVADPPAVLDPVSAVIRQIAPTCGPEGTTVAIQGAGMAGATEVRFGDTLVPSSSFQFASETEIRVPSPSVSGSFPLRVTTGAGVSSPSLQPFTSPCPTAVTGAADSPAAQSRPASQAEPPPGVPKAPGSLSSGSGAGGTTPVIPGGPGAPAGSVPVPISNSVPVVASAGQPGLQSGSAAVPTTAGQTALGAGIASAGAGVPEPAVRHAMVGLDRNLEGGFLVVGMGFLLTVSCAAALKNERRVRQQPAACPAPAL